MSSKFEDIKIVSFDEKASGPSGIGSLMKLILRLSAVAPSEWADFFNLAWQRHIYMMKRDVAAYGDAIEILCAPDELESDHLPEIKKVIAKANAAYRQHLTEQERLREEAKAEKARENAVLSDLKGRLNFD